MISTVVSQSEQQIAVYKLKLEGIQILKEMESLIPTIRIFKVLEQHSQKICTLKVS